MERNLKNIQSTHKSPGIAYISKSKIVLYTQGASTTTTITFPPDVVRDLDIIDESKLHSLIQRTLSDNKIAPSSVSLILANDLLFAKQMMNNDIKAQNTEEQDFINMVPYESVSARRIPFNSGIFITVANKDFYEGIIKSLEKLQFSVPLILPAYIFSKDLNFANELSVQSLQLLLSKINNFRQFNFIQKEIITNTEDSAQTPNVSGTKPSESANSKPKSNRVFILAGVFIMLIGVLLAVYLWSSQANEPVRKPAPVAVPSGVSPTSPVSATQSAITTTPIPNVQGAQDQMINLSYSNSNSQNAIIVISSLENAGFTEIITSVSASKQATTISFNNNLSDTTKNKIISSVSRVYDNIIVRNTSTVKSVDIELGSE